ncbi:MAG: DUF393 domain-containing protein [Pseudomonadota bacterium]
MANKANLKVFYDGGCPLCESEISFYKKRSGAEQVDWVDVSNTNEEYVHPGLSRAEALARFHVVTKEGEVLSGGRAFAGLWRSISVFKPFGWIFRIKPLAWLLDRLYDYFLRHRPRLQKWFAKKSEAHQKQHS